MNDTTSAIFLKMMEMIRQKSPAERLEMGCSMHDFSKCLVTEAIRRDKPGLSAAELRVGIFLKFYGSEFDDIRREKIIKHLSRINPSPE
jgi:hypothetical protein